MAAGSWSLAKFYWPVMGKPTPIRKDQAALTGVGGRSVRLGRGKKKCRLGLAFKVMVIILRRTLLFLINRR